MLVLGLGFDGQQKIMMKRMFKMHFESDNMHRKQDL